MMGEFELECLKDSQNYQVQYLGVICAVGGLKKHLILIKNYCWVCSL